MEATNYKSIGPVLQLNKAGELTQKRMKAVKVCDGLYITEPDKSNFVRYIIECEGVMWVESTQSKSYMDRYAAMMPEALKKVKEGFYNGEHCNNFCREIDRRINHPDSPAIMELKKPERKKPEPLPEGVKKVSVYMCKGCTDETTDKKVIITELAPHVYTYTYKLKKYGERVKVVFEIDGVYFEAVDKSAFYMEREDFTEVCSKAYASARKNIAEGAAKGMPYFAELQKRIGTPVTTAETPRISTEAAETVNVSAEDEKAEKTANFNDETRRYIIDTFKTKENMVAKFMDAIKSDKAELDEYKANTRKGGKFRKERMQRLEDSATELAKQMEEWSAIFDEPLPIEEPHDHITIYQSALEQCNALADNPEIMLHDDVARVERKDGKTARIIATNFDDGFLHCPLYFVVYVDEMPMLENYATLESAIEAAKADIPPNPFGTLEPPQSPEAPQTVERTADTPKPRETARKPRNRNFRFSQPRTCKNFLIIQSVPRLAKCSTAHHIAGVSKMVYSAIAPPGYAPPIRGDCKLSISTRAKPPNRARSDITTNYKPP